MSNLYLIKHQGTPDNNAVLADKNGSPFKVAGDALTFTEVAQACHDDAVNGDKITIAAGTFLMSDTWVDTDWLGPWGTHSDPLSAPAAALGWYNRISCTKDIIWEGAVDGSNDPTTIITAGNSSKLTGFLFHDSCSFVLRNVQFQEMFGVASINTPGVVENCRHNGIYGCYISYLSASQIYVDPANGNYLLKNQLLFRDCKFTAMTLWPLYAAGGGVKVENCEFRDAGTASVSYLGPVFQDRDAVANYSFIEWPEEAHGFEIKNCIFDNENGTNINSGMHGIYIRPDAKPMEDIVITGCTFNHMETLGRPIYVWARNAPVREMDVVDCNFTGPWGGNRAMTYLSATSPNYISGVRSSANVYTSNYPTCGTSAWQASTAYVIGDKVTNFGVVYMCTTAGTSAASGGPQGPGLAIPDGTVVWRGLFPTYPLTPINQLNRTSDAYIRSDFTNSEYEPNNGYFARSVVGLSSTTSYNVIHLTGKYPDGKSAEGTNWIVDLGYNNRIVGSPANNLEKPAGIGGEIQETIDVEDWWATT